MKRKLSELKEKFKLRVNEEPEEIEEVPPKEVKKETMTIPKFTEQKAKEKPEEDTAKYQLTEMARRELISRVKALNPEEMKLVVDNLPIELCYNRIGEELQKFKETKKKFKQSMEAMK